MALDMKNLNIQVLINIQFKKKKKTGCFLSFWTGIWVCEDSCNHPSIQMTHYNIVSLVLKETHLMPLTYQYCQQIALIDAAM